MPESLPVRFQRDGIARPARGRAAFQSRPIHEAIVALHLESTAELFDETLVLNTQALAFGSTDEVLTEGLIDLAFGETTHAS